MIIANIDQAHDTVDVTFEFNELIEGKEWSHKMTFNSKKYGVIVKDYKIVKQMDGMIEKFVLDEQNGIVMDLTFLNNCFYGMYEVMDMIYTVTLRKTAENQLFFDLYAAPLKDPNITQTDSGVSPTPIEAKSYKPTISQSVLLIKED